MNEVKTLSEETSKGKIKHMTKQLKTIEIKPNQKREEKPLVVVKYLLWIIREKLLKKSESVKKLKIENDRKIFWILNQ